MTSLLGHEVCRKIEHTPMLFIAAITGYATGGGLELALACDLRVAARGDYRLGLPEIKRGLFPAMGGTQRLPRLIDLPGAIDMIATGRSVNPDEAHKLGLLEQLFDGAEACQAAAHECCATLAAGDAEAALEREAIAKVVATEDASEGILAFTEKRPPAFTGR